MSLVSTGVSLNLGDIENSNGGRRIRCKEHGYTFNLDKNGLLESPLLGGTQLAGVRLPVYETEVNESGEVFVSFNDFDIDYD